MASPPRQTIDRRRDDAARAGWLYFIGGCTQDDIAAQLDLSRQAVQRLVAFAVSEKLIKFRLDHPIARCCELSAALCEAHGLEFCDVTPTVEHSPEAVTGIAVAAALRLQRMLASKTPLVLCVGTGRTLRAAVEELDVVERPQHKIVSLVGAMALGGQASAYDVVMRLGDKTSAQRYPMPAPVLTETESERADLHSHRSFKVLEELRQQARASFVGIGEIGWQSPLHADGFLGDTDISTLVDDGAVGEITGWSFGVDGAVIDTAVNRRVASLALESPPERLTVVVGGGPKKIVPIRAALQGGLISALITDETTAEALLDANSADLAAQLEAR